MMMMLMMMMLMMWMMGHIDTLLRSAVNNFLTNAFAFLSKYLGKYILPDKIF